MAPIDHTLPAGSGPSLKGGGGKEVSRWGPLQLSSHSRVYNTLLPDGRDLILDISILTEIVMILFYFSRDKNSGPNVSPCVVSKRACNAWFMEFSIEGDKQDMSESQRDLIKFE